MNRFEERMLRSLSKIATNTDKIATNTKEYDWVAFTFGEDKENIPEYFACNKVVYAFASGIINAFKENGSQGVADFIMLHERRNDIQNALDPDCSQIAWSTEDFEARAVEIEEARGEGQIFDRSKFLEALYTMMNRHDAHIGVTWDTVDHYLEEYCLLTKGEQK